MNYKESETLELKKSTSELKEAVISIASILNKHRKGKLYFGIKNNGTVIGQQIGDSTLRTVSQAIKEHIEPKIYPKINVEIIDKKSCVIIDFEGDNVPYFAYGRAYMRVADEDRQLSVREIELLMLDKNNYRSLWESKISEVSVKEASIKVVRNFVKRSNEAGRINYRYDNLSNVLNKLGLIQGKHLLNASLVLFSSKHMYEVQAAIFAGNDKITFLDIQSFRGNLFEVFRRSEQYIKEHINWRAEIKDKRYEIPEIPIEAVREAIINSLCHRDYTDLKGNEIAIFKDRIEIYNPGRFPENHSPQDFITGSERSILRNPLIANAFFLTSDIERWGSGLKRICDVSRTGIKVEFKNLKSGFLVIFYRPKEKVTDRITTKVTDKVTINQKKILDQISINKHISSSELANKIEVSVRKTKLNIKKLKDKGLLKRIGSSRIGYWEIAGKVSEKVTDKVTINQKKILDQISINKHISSSELASKIEVSVRKTKLNIKKLKDKGLLKRIGPDKGGHWEIQQ
jgi:ATP-dependent DNA helicase RecG